MLNLPLTSDNFFNFITAIRAAEQCDRHFFHSLQFLASAFFHYWFTDIQYVHIRPELHWPLHKNMILYIRLCVAVQAFSDLKYSQRQQMLNLERLRAHSDHPLKGNLWPSTADSSSPHSPVHPGTSQPITASDRFTPVSEFYCSPRMLAEVLSFSFFKSQTASKYSALFYPRVHALLNVLQPMYLWGPVV